MIDGAARGGRRHRRLARIPGGISGLVKNALDYIEDMREDSRVYLDNKPWGCISCAYGWQAAVGTLRPAARQSDMPLQRLADVRSA